MYARSVPLFGRGCQHISKQTQTMGGKEVLTLSRQRRWPPRSLGMTLLFSYSDSKECAMKTVTQSISCCQKFAAAKIIATPSVISCQKESPLEKPG